MNLCLSVIVTMAFIIMAASQSPDPTLAPTWNRVTGDWSTLDPKLAAVKDAAKYAVSKTYPLSKTGIKVVRAKGRTTDGRRFNYDMDVAVTYIGNRSCSMQNYMVSSPYPIPPKVDNYELKTWTLLTSKCRSK